MIDSDVHRHVALSRRVVRNVVGSIGAFAASVMFVLAVSPAAEASSPFCGGTYGGYGWCYGAYRTMTAVDGIGQDHSVCVAYTYQAGVGWAQSGSHCSSGPGQYAVYNIGGVGAYGQPFIQNNAAGSNRMQGHAY